MADGLVDRHSLPDDVGTRRFAYRCGRIVGRCDDIWCRASDGLSIVYAFGLVVYTRAIYHASVAAQFHVHVVCGWKWLCLGKFSPRILHPNAHNTQKNRFNLRDTHPNRQFHSDHCWHFDVGFGPHLVASKYFYRSLCIAMLVASFDVVDLGESMVCERKCEPRLGHFCLRFGALLHQPPHGDCRLARCDLLVFCPFWLQKRSLQARTWHDRHWIGRFGRILWNALCRGTKQSCLQLGEPKFLAQPLAPHERQTI